MGGKQQLVVESGLETDLTILVVSVFNVPIP
jgi:hypothetical protein